MKNGILEEIHKYDDEKKLKEYNIDLWSVVYLLILSNKLEYNGFIFSLKSKYSEKYYNKKIPETGSSNLDTNNAIERKLQKLGLISGSYNRFGLTHDGRKTINDIYFDFNGNFFQKAKKRIKENDIANKIISLIGLIK